MKRYIVFLFALFGAAQLSMAAEMYVFSNMELAVAAVGDSGVNRILAANGISKIDELNGIVGWQTIQTGASAGVYGPAIPQLKFSLIGTEEEQADGSHKPPASHSEFVCYARTNRCFNVVVSWRGEPLVPDWEAKTDAALDAIVKSAPRLKAADGRTLRWVRRSTPT